MDAKIFIGKGVVSSSLAATLCHVANKFAIITDIRVEELYGIPLKNKLSNHYETFLFSFPEGEENKSRARKEELEDRMLSEKLGRDTAIIALGGGVVTDLAGFIASTYCRGIPFVSIPTTLLGMVDASIGGKVGVNTPFGKNMIGAFYNPQAIYIDPDFLATLPPPMWRDGAAEIIKYALISSPSLFAFLQTGLEKWRHFDETFLLSLIHESCAIKKGVVERDPYEKGIRRILNFGHTIGHALETASSYELSHGEAIAIGMAAESFLSFRLGLLKEKDLISIVNLFRAYDFSFSLPPSLSKEQICHAMKFDKKSLLSVPRFVLLDEIGKAAACEGAFCRSVERNIINETLDWMIATYA